MYRQILTPTEHNHVIPVTIPHEWYGQQVEIIVFPIMKEEPKKAASKKEKFMKLCGAWESDKSAEEMVAELRTARHFRKKDLTF